jgi:hypothetical protein
MTFSYKVGRVEEYLFEQLPEGRYLAEIENFETKTYEKNFIPYEVYEVTWLVVEDGLFIGKKFIQTFRVNHENNMTRHIAINNFNKFCQEIGGVKEDEEISLSNILYKKAHILLQNGKPSKDGRVYLNLVQHTLFDSKTNMAKNGISLPEKSPSGSVNLNDNVPF